MGKKESDYGRQAFRILQTAYVLAPLFAGIDKFFNALTIWSMYITPFFLRLIHYQANRFMHIVGAIEIIAGIGVFYKPKFFSKIVALWLFLILLNLLIQGLYLDVALRDFGLFLGALALVKLSKKYA